MTKVTKNMAKQFKTMYQSKNLSFRQIGKEFNLDHSTVKYHLEKQKINFRPEGRHSKKIIIPKRISNKKAYILGVVGPGDGYLMYQKSKAYRIGLRTVDIEFAEKFKFYLEELYDLKCSLNQEIVPGNQKVHIVILHSKEACKDLLSYVDDVSELKEKTWVIPKIIEKFSTEEKASYIKGFADSQGCVTKYKFSRSILLSSVNINGLEQIKKVLLDLNIKSFIRTNRKGSDIVITGFHNLKRFQDKINFTINSKLGKLNEILNGYKYNIKKEHTHTSIVSGLLPEMFRLRKSGLSYGNIAKEINLDKTTVHKRLRGNNSL